MGMGDATGLALGVPLTYVEAAWIGRYLTYWIPRELVYLHSPVKGAR